MRVKFSCFLFLLVLFLLAGCQTAQKTEETTTTTTTTNTTTTTSATTTTTTTSTSITTSTSTSTSSTTTTTNVYNLTIPTQQNTWASENLPNSILYSGTTHSVGYWTIFGGFSDYGYIQFNISDIPSNATISNANLKLYIQEVPGVDTTIYFYNIFSSWDETNLTWNSNRPSSTGSSIASKTFATTDSGWITVDITDAVQQWVNGTITNNGLMFKSTNIIQWNIIQYYSKASSVNKPKLEITAVY